MSIYNRTILSDINVPKDRIRPPCGVEGCERIAVARVHDSRMAMENPPAKYPPGEVRELSRLNSVLCREHIMDFVGIDVGERSLRGLWEDFNRW